MDQMMLEVHAKVPMMLITLAVGWSLLRKEIVKLMGLSVS